jgi:PAS domain S-box-containing protein
MQDTTRADQAPPNLPVNILLVDDQSANLLALEAILQDLGHNLVQAHSGDEALRRLEGEEFALVLLDVQMPGRDGFETAKLIRGRAGAPHTPIIFVTAYDDDRFPVERAYSLGAVDYLVKPLVPVILRAKVAGFVELFQKTQQVKWQAERLRHMERQQFEGRLAQENARLRESEERFRGLMEQAPFSIQVFSPDGRTVRVNRAWEELWGATLDRIADYNILHDPQLEAKGVRPLLERAFGGEAVRIPAIQYDPDRTRHGDPLRWVGGVAYPLKDTGGRVREVVLIHEDITARKRLEDQLRQRAEQLAESDRHKNEFLAMLAHELRNPLAPVRNSLQVLKMPGADGPTVEQARSMMERQIQHLVRLVDDLLDVSRIIRGRIPLSRERVDLEAVVGRAVETAQPVLDAHGHQLLVSLPPCRVLLDADLVRLSQVVTNLLTNAAKYSGRAGRIWLTAEGDGAEVLVRVRDSGVGIAPELLPRIFDLFVQGDKSLARSEGGLGVGLTLAQRLVQMHGGSISASSEGTGQGSEFVVRLPVLPEAAESRADGQGAEGRTPAKSRCRRVLVVDDNVDSAESTAMLLRLWGHEAQTVHDGPSVLRAVREFGPEIILLDIGLPGISGYEVAQQLRSQPEFGALLLAAMTGYGQDEDRRRSREAGFDHHLTKPLDPEKLEALIASWQSS